MAADVYIKLNLSLLQRCFFLNQCRLLVLPPLHASLNKRHANPNPIASRDSHVMISLDNLTVTASDS